MGLIFTIFWESQYIPKEIVKILCIFVAKSQEMGTFFQKIRKYGFLEKLPLNMVLEHIHDQSKS